MSHTVVGRKKLLNRVKRIKGQALSLESSLENTLEAKHNCMAILQQVAAIKGAVNGLMKEVLESHLREHLGADNLTKDQRLEEVEQVINILKSYLK